MTRKINQKAWAILLDDERMALSLQHVADKSSWQAGEIMAKSHYKYLEIKYRAENFLKMFTEHFEVFDALIPDFITGDSAVIMYFRKCVEQRKRPMVAIEELNTELPLKNKLTKVSMNGKIESQLKKWESSDNAYDLNVFHLVKEFDRWNNFRILPKNCQEPSAFKRRVKNIQKRRVKLLLSIPEISIKKLSEIFGIKRKPCVYLPVFENSKPIVLMVKNKPNVIQTISQFSLYLFSTESEAKQYLEVVQSYTSKANRECQDGLTFWPNYRAMIKQAINFEAVDNIIPSRRYLKLALSKIEFY